MEGGEDFFFGGAGDQFSVAKNALVSFPFAAVGAGGLGDKNVVFFGAGPAEKNGAPIGGLGGEEIAGFRARQEDLEFEAVGEADMDVLRAVLDDFLVLQDAGAEGGFIERFSDEIDITTEGTLATDGTGDFQAFAERLQTLGNLFGVAVGFGEGDELFHERFKIPAIHSAIWGQTAFPAA